MPFTVDCYDYSHGYRGGGYHQRRMRRLYVGKADGKGWTPVGWQCEYNPSHVDLDGPHSTAPHLDRRKLRPQAEAVAQ
jgi:hypothetical protein